MRKSYVGPACRSKIPQRWPVLSRSGLCQPSLVHWSPSQWRAMGFPVAPSQERTWSPGLEASSEAFTAHWAACQQLNLRAPSPSHPIFQGVPARGNVNMQLGGGGSHRVMCVLCMMIDPLHLSFSLSHLLLLRFPIAWLALEVKKARPAASRNGTRGRKLARNSSIPRRLLTLHHPAFDCLVRSILPSLVATLLPRPYCH